MTSPKRWPYRGAQLSFREAVALQAELRERVVEVGEGSSPRTVAGVDVSVKGGEARAAVCVFAFPELVPLERATRALPLAFPYIPGLLGFREVPAVLAALERLREPPDLLLVDGHGRAHPRRFGVACHVGVELDLPAIGVGKSLLVGSCAEPGLRRGASTRLVHDGEVVGRALRTRAGVRPVFVSVGHRVDLARAAELVLACAPRFRLPEPIRAADALAGELPVRRSSAFGSRARGPHDRAEGSAAARPER